MSDEKTLNTPNEDVREKRTIVLESIGEDMIAEQKKAQATKEQEALASIAIKESINDKKKYKSDEELARAAQEQGLGIAGKKAPTEEFDRISTDLEQKTRIFDVNKTITEAKLGMDSEEAAVEAWEDEVAAKATSVETKNNATPSQAVDLSTAIEEPVVSIRKKRTYKKRVKPVLASESVASTVRKKSHRKIVAERKLANRMQSVGAAVEGGMVANDSINRKLSSLFFLAVLIFVLAGVLLFLILL